MRTSSIFGACFAAGVALSALTAVGCSNTDEGPEYVMGPVGSGGSGTNASGGSGTNPSAGSGTNPGGGSGSSTAGSATTGGSGTSDAGSSSGGSGNGGSGDTGGSSNGGTGTQAGGSGGSGGSGTVQPKGHFKLLAYYETRGFAHDSIPAGLQMLKDMGAANDFEVVGSDGEQPDNDPNRLNDPQITKEGLAPFDMIFFMNPTGDIFTAAEKQVFIDFLHEKKAFAGVHSTTDTEHSWTWYEELVGEIYASHTPGVPQGTLTLDQSQLNHPSLVGIQSPWTRNDEWYKFSKGRVSGNALPGLQVLIRFGGPELSPGATVGQPISWYRNWEGIRSFYTAMGHPKEAYAEADVKKHILGGILWAVRRLQP